jgi:hypothetical protein
LASLAVAAALAISPVASAQAYNFDFSSGGITLNGTFATAATPNSANAPNTSYTILSFTGTFDDTITGVDGSISLIPLRSGVGAIGSPAVAQNVQGGGNLTYDNQFWPGGAPDGTSAVFDYTNSIGLFVTPPGGPTDEYSVFIWGNLGSDTYSIYEAGTGQSLTNLNGDPAPAENPTVAANLPFQGNVGGASVVYVSEPGSLSMLALCLVILAGGFFSRMRQSGLV